MYHPKVGETVRLYYSDGTHQGTGKVVRIEPTMTHCYVVEPDWLEPHVRHRDRYYCAGQLKPLAAAPQEAQ